MRQNLSYIGPTLDIYRVYGVTNVSDSQVRKHTSLVEGGEEESIVERKRISLREGYHRHVPINQIGTKSGVGQNTIS